MPTSRFHTSTEPRHDDAIPVRDITAPSDNLARIAALHADENARRQYAVSDALADIGVWDTPSNIPCSPTMARVRAWLRQRAIMTFAQAMQAEQDVILREYASLCTPNFETFVDVPLARGFFATYAGMAWRYSTVAALAAWLLEYSDSIASMPHNTALDALVTRTYQGLTRLASYCERFYGVHDYAPDGGAGVLVEEAIRQFGAQERKAWHDITDPTRKPAPRKLSKNEKRRKASNRNKRRHSNEKLV